MEKYVKNWFHFYDTSASFQAHLKSGFIHPDAVAFINETGQIYAQQNLFGICRKRYEELEKLVAKHVLILKNILGEEGPSVDNGIIDNLREITDFLTGYSTDETLEGVLTAIQDNLEAQINAVAEDLAAKYEDLTSRIDNLTNALFENVELLDARIDANAANIVKLQTRQDALISQLDDHIKEWQEFKAAYDAFYNYVDERLHAIDENYHAQQDSIIQIHLDIENIRTEVNEFNDKVERCINLVNNLHVLVDRLDVKFDELSQEVADFFNTKGHPNGLAPLDADGKVPAIHLPSYVDDVLEFSSRDAFPEVGEDGKIYVAIDTNLTYRWTGTQYIEISKSLALGETSTTAYPGDKGKKVTEDLAAHKADYNNPHRVTTAQLGLDKVNNTSDLDKPISTATQAALDAIDADLDAHIADKSNPHEVTKTQVGLGNVDNTSDADKPISSATQSALNLANTKIDSHIADKENPHEVTKAQVGLGNVNNTSDADKPISNATQAALDVLDTSLDTHIADKTNPHNVTKEQLGLGNVENTADKDKPVSDAVQNVLDTKVDKIIGKGLSTNDFTNEDKSKLDNLMSNRKLSTEEINELTSKNVGDLIYNITINKYVYWNGTSWEEVGDTDLSNYVTKDELEAMDALVDTKVDKVAGKELSSNDFTDEYKGILDNPWGETIE